MKQMRERRFFTMAPCDAAEPWQLGFQDAATPMMQGIIDLHHDIFFFLILILVFVSWILGRAYLKFYLLLTTKSRFIFYGPILEIIRTLLGYTLLISCCDLSICECAGNDPTPDMGEASSAPPPQEREQRIKLPRTLRGEAFDQAFQSKLQAILVDHFGWYLGEYRSQILQEFPNASGLDSLSFLSKGTSSLCADYGLDNVSGPTNLRIVEETIHLDIEMSKTSYTNNVYYDTLVSLCKDMR